jgi:SIR2-like domain
LETHEDALNTIIVLVGEPVKHGSVVGGDLASSKTLLVAYARGEACSIGCMLCAERVPFSISTHLLRAFEEQRVLVFAGAGISTEGANVYPYSLYQDIAGELGESAEHFPFPELMSRFCQEPDGRSRLLLKIRKRIQYVQSHPELLWTATRFHRELSTIWQVDEIVTTNWDDFFESHCGATPFITDADLAFWSQPGRKVLKLHGSIHSLGDMVVTSADYEACYKRLSTGLLGSHLKALLASRTVVFIGYSLTDPDLQKIIGALTHEMRGLRPTYYVVTPEPESTSQFTEVAAVHIRCGGTHFASAVKQWLARSPCTVPDSSFGRLAKLNSELSVLHSQLYERRPLSKYPETVHCASYQDGLHHALDRAANLAHTGRYSHRCELQELRRSYSAIRRDKLHRQKYHDVAYIDGYVNGLILLEAERDLSGSIPRFYVFGAKDQPRTFAAYRRLANDSARLHRAAHMQAGRLVRGMAEPGTQLEELAFHHTPFLL